MKTKRYSLLVLSVFLILLVFIASASAADSNETDVLAADGPTNTIDEKLALDYSTEVSVANDSNVIENDKEILQVANSDDVLGDINIDYTFPKTIDLGKDYTFTFNIRVDDPEQHWGQGVGRIRIGDYEKEEHGVIPSWGEIIVNYDKSPGSFTGSFEFEDDYGNKASTTFPVTVRSGPGTIYVNSSADSGGDGSEASPFQNMQYALEAAGDSDTIMIAAGTYTGYYNRWLTIENNNLTLTKYGDGEAIFDEEDCRFFTSYVDALTININGLTFKNADYVFYSEFRDMKDSTINATFINIGNDGGCPIFLKSADNVDITGKFINNPGKLINIKQSSSNVKIHDAIFINNNGDSLFNIEGSSNQITNCWFGNNATNYTSKPDVGNFEMNDWLFMNATVDSSELGLGESSKITFDLYSYDSGSTAKYDASKMNLNLDLTQTLGELDKDAASLGEEVVYTARQGGDAEVTATFETASYTVGLTNFAGIWYVNGSKTSSGNGKSEENAFKTLSEAISAASDGQTIMIAAGTYAGDNNVGLQINLNNLTLIKYGDGEAIFDGQSAGEMLNLVTNSAPKSINIKGLTFKNAMIYAIAFYGDYGVSDSSINATFINIGTGQWGSAIFAKSAENVDITGIFINNNAGEGLIQMPNSKNIRIHDSIFINNGENTLFKINESSIIDNNWFGNNATNYDTAPADAGITLDNWLFLNATADPSELEIDGSSKITFKLSSYDGSTVSDYTGPIDIQLDLTQTLGELDKDAALLGEEITYTAKQSGDASITATFETVSMTITLTNADPRTPTEINVTNSTLDLKVNDEIDAGATLTPADAGNLTYTSSNSSVAIVENGKIKALKEGKAIITVSFAGNDQYRPAVNKTIDVTVTLRDAKWTYIGLSGIEDDLDGASLYLPLNYVPDCFVRDADGMGLPAGTNITVFCEGNKNYTINTVTQENGLFNIDVSNVEPYQVYTVTFSADGYTAAIASVYVIKAPTVIDVANATVELKVKDEVAAGASLDPSEAGNLTYTSSNSSVAIVEDGKIVAVGEGSAIITVSFAGNDIYAAAQNKTISVTVSLRDANWTFINMITGKEEELDGAFLYLPWNYIPDCYVKDADGVGLPAGTNITIFCKDDGNFIIGTITIINTTVQENGLFNVDVSNVKPDKTYSVSFSAEGYTTATATIRVVKAPTVIDVTNSTLDLKVNDEIDAGATLTPADAGNLTYTSSNSSVAVVENGKIKAISEGSATITVSFAGDNVYAAAENKTIDVTVALRDASVTVDEESMDLFIGGEGTIDAYTTPEGLNVNFKSNNESVVTVDANGKVTTVGLGNTTITVSVGGDGVYALNSTDVTVNVDKITTEILVTNETFFLKALENVSAGATLIPDAGNLIYYSSNTTVAEVQDGIIKALKKGIATITIRFEGNETHAAASKTIDVTVDVNDASVSVDNDTLDLLVKDTFNLVPTTVPEGLTVTYASSNESVVMVKDNGEIYALDIGNATVTVSVGGDGVYALNTTEVKVTVKGPTEIIVENTTVDMKVGDDNVIVNATLIPDVAGELDFTSSDVSVVTVNGIGELTAVGEGTANITVSFGGNDKYVAAQNKTVTVTVTKIDTSISVTNTTVDMEVSDSAIIGAALTPVDAGELDFTSSDVSVVTVNGIGELYAVGDGIANITVSFGGNDKYAAAESKIIAVTVSLKDASVSVENDTVELFVDDTFTINATTAPAGLDVTYVPDNSGVVSVDENGTVTALKEGIANITVKVGGDGVYALNTTNVAVKVSKIPTKIIAENATVEMNVSDEAALVVSLVPSGAGELDFTSSDVSVVTVNGIGELTAVGEGSANITVSFGGNDKYAAAENKTITVSVYKIATEILIENKTLDLIVRDNVATGATLLPSEAGNLTYVSSNELVAKVVDGMIVAVGEGNATITVAFEGDYKYSAAESKTIDVTVKKTDSSIDIEIKVVELIVGEDATFTVVLPEDATGVLLVDVDGNKYYADVENGNATVKLVGLTPGNYTADVVYPGDDKYSNASGSIDVKVADLIIPKVNITVPEVKVGEEAKVIVELPENATGTVDAIVDGKNVAAILVFGSPVSIPLGELSAGNHSVVVIYSGNKIYTTGGDFKNFTVDKLSTNVTAEPVEIIEGETATVIVVVDANATGIVMVDVGGNKYYGNVDAGKANVDVTGLDAGNYTAEITYPGDDKYAEVTGSVSVNVVEHADPKINITIPDIDPGESSVVNVTLPSDATGNVSVLVDGKEVSSVSVTNGSAKVTVPELAAGNHTVEVKYSGDSKYAPISKTSSVNVPKVDVPANSTSIKVTLAVGSKSPKFNITLPNDAKGYVVISINGADYFAVVENGTAIVSVPSLAYGSYDVNVTYSGDDKYNSFVKNTTAKIPKPKLTAKNISIAYTNPYKYKVCVTIDGKAVVKQYVTFKFNGKTYKRLTNAKGYATLTLPKVKPKKAKYTITMKYKDISLSKKIKVNSIIVAKNLKAKKSAKALKIRVKLKTVAKKVQRGKKVTLRFAGKTYKAKTNKKGIATFTINKNVLNKLRVGKKYSYRVTYGQDVVNKKITVKK